MPQAPIEQRPRHEADVRAKAATPRPGGPRRSRGRPRRPSAVAGALVEPSPPLCQACALRDACGVDRAGSDVEHLRLRAGERLYASNDAASSLYAIRSGAFLVRRDTGAGPRILGFRLPGEAVGVDGFDSGRYRCEAVALADGEVCRLSVAAVLGRRDHDAHARQAIDHLLGQEIARAHDLIAILGIQGAEKRLARFLLDLISRQRCVDGGRAAMTLAMSREQIGSYLGMTIETTSRSFSALRALGILRVDLREVEITDVAALVAVTA